MTGPIAAAMRARSAPSDSIAATADSITPPKRALPAGMGGTDHAGLRVGEQDRRAIGGEDAEREAGPVGDDGVGMGAGIVGPGLGGDQSASAEWT